MNQPFSSNQKSPAFLNGQGSMSHAPGKFNEDELDNFEDDFAGDIGEITAIQVTPDEAKKLTSERIAKSGLPDQTLDPTTQQFMQLDIGNQRKVPGRNSQVVAIAPDPDDLPFMKNKAPATNPLNVGNQPQGSLAMKGYQQNPGPGMGNNMLNGFNGTQPMPQGTARGLPPMNNGLPANRGLNQNNQFNPMTPMNNMVPGNNAPFNNANMPSSMPNGMMGTSQALAPNGVMPGAMNNRAVAPQNGANGFNSPINNPLGAVNNSQMPAPAFDANGFNNQNVFSRPKEPHVPPENGSAFYKSQILPEGVSPTFISPNNSEEKRPTKSLAPVKRDLDNIQVSPEDVARVTREIWGDKDEKAAPAAPTAPNPFNNMPMSQPLNNMQGGMPQIANSIAAAPMANGMHSGMPNSMGSNMSAPLGGNIAPNVPQGMAPLPSGMPQGLAQGRNQQQMPMPGMAGNNAMPSSMNAVPNGMPQMNQGMVLNPSLNQPMPQNPGLPQGMPNSMPGTLNHGMAQPAPSNMPFGNPNNFSPNNANINEMPKGGMGNNAMPNGMSNMQDFNEPEIDIRAHALAALAMGSGANAATLPNQNLNATPSVEAEQPKSATFMPDDYAMKNPNAPSTLINGKFFDFNQNQEQVRSGLDNAARTEAQNTAEQKAKEALNQDPSSIVTAAGPAGVSAAANVEPPVSSGIDNFLGAHKENFATMQNLSRIASGEMSEPAEISTGSTNVIKTLPSKRELSPEESAAAFASALIAKSNRGSDSTRIQGVTHNSVESLPTVNTMIFGAGTNPDSSNKANTADKKDEPVNVEGVSFASEHKPSIFDDRHTTTILSNHHGRLVSDDLGHLSSVDEHKTNIPSSPSVSFSFDKLEKEREERIARGEKDDPNTLSIVDFTSDKASDKDSNAESSGNKSSDDSINNSQKSNKDSNKKSDDVQFTMFSLANDDTDISSEDSTKKASVPMEDELPAMNRPSFFTEEEASKGPFILDVNLRDTNLANNKDKLDRMFKDININDLPELPEIEDTQRFNSLQNLHDLNKELREFESWGINLDDINDKDKESRLSKEDMRLLEEGLHDKDTKALEEARAKLKALQEIQELQEKLAKAKAQEAALNGLSSSENAESSMSNTNNAPAGEQTPGNTFVQDAFSRLMAQADMKGGMNATTLAASMAANAANTQNAANASNAAMTTAANMANGVNSFNPISAFAPNSAMNNINPAMNMNNGQNADGNMFNQAAAPKDVLQPNPLAMQAVAPIAPGVLSNYLLRCKTEVRNTGYFMQRGLTPETIERFALGFDAHFRVDNSQGMFPMPGNIALWQAAIVPLNENSYVAYNMNPMASADDKVRRVGQESCFNLRAIYASLPDLDQSALQSLTWPPMCEANETPIFITSDEMDALSLESLNYRAIALGTPSNVSQFVDFVKQSGISGINFYLCLDNSPKWAECRRSLKDALQNLDELCHEVNLSAPFMSINEALTNNRGLLLNKLMHLYEISDINLQETIAPATTSSLLLSLENLAKLQLGSMMYTMSSPAVAVTRLVIASLIENKQSSILYAGSKMQWQMICSLLSFAAPNNAEDKFGSGSHMQLNGYQAKFLELPLDNDVESLSGTINHGLMAARLNGINNPTLMLDTSGFDNSVCAMLSPRLAQIAVNMNIPVMVWCSHEQRGIFEGNSVQCIEMKQGASNEIIFSTLDQACRPHTFSTLQ